MKKNLCLIIILLNPIICFSQEKLDFAITYLPNTEYSVISTQLLDFKVYDISSDLEVDEKEVESSKDSTELKYKIITGEDSEEGIPLVIELLNSAEGDRFKKGTKIYGKSKGVKVELDSISSKWISDLNNNEILNSAQSMISQVEFPRRELKINENFTHNNIMNLSTGLFPIKLDVEATYTLLEIVNGIGIFNLVKEYKMNSDIDGIDINFIGNGNGQLEYNNKYRFITKSDFSFNMQLNMKIEDVEFKTVMKGRTLQDVEINRIINSEKENEK